MVMPLELGLELECAKTSVSMPFLEQLLCLLGGGVLVAPRDVRVTFSVAGFRGGCGLSAWLVGGTFRQFASFKFFTVSKNVLEKVALSTM